MAGMRHQFIMGLVIRNMREFGCRIKFVDGKYIVHYGEQIRIPPKVLRHRPDILGLTDSGQICIGEAKTESDINSLRTKEQISDFTRLELNGMPCEVFIGVPSMVRERFNNTLLVLGLANYPHLHILYVPEEIINE